MINNYLNQDVISLEESKYAYKTTYNNESEEVDIKGLELDTIVSYFPSIIVTSTVENIEHNILAWDDKVCYIDDNYGIFNEFLDDTCVIEGVNFGMVYEDINGDLHICEDIEDIDEKFEFDYDDPIGVVLLKND